MNAKQFDTIVIGAGLVGLSTVYRLLQRQPGHRVLIVEKEKIVGAHQSGNNSGVIHSGIYYKPRSLKALNCIAGYNDLIRFAKIHGIPFELCGKVIVASSKKELPALYNIYNRGIENGLKKLQLIGPAELAELEPHVTGEAAIHVPQTGIIDYPAVAKKLQELIVQTGGEIAFGEPVVGIKNRQGETIVETVTQAYSSKNVVTCGGLHSDRLASMTNTQNDLRILPFRGEYYQLKTDREFLIKHLVYPVPNPSFPFLGVHFTRMIGGGVEAGPNAVLAFKREGYRFRHFDFSDNIETLTWPGFWRVVAKYGKTGLGEIHRSLSKSAFTKALQKLVPEIQESDLISGGAGVRAQACDRSGNLIDDFNIIKHNNVIHVRNAPSPAATSCLSIGNYIVDQLLY